ncbi:MAG TPA: hypothetical protein PKE29_06520 [Phycisphaerales bacterium]|nr:hypothetical protein [Phycisphaerales bacterium]
MLTQSEQTDRSFEAHAKEVGFRLRRVLAELAASVRVDISQPRSAARELGVDKTLAWKVSKIAMGSDPVAAMWVLPGTPSQKTLLRAFEEAGAPAALLTTAREVLDEFQTMVDEHAGDRETFEILLSSIAAGDPQAREAQRKQAFQANSAIWGVSCRARTWTYIVTPGRDDPDKGDIAMVGSYVHVNRLRRSAEWPLAAVGAVDERGNQLGAPLHKVLPSQGDVTQDPSLPEYCRGRIPSIRRERRVGGMLEYRMEGGAVGKTAAFDWAAGWRYKGCVLRWRTPTDGQIALALNVMVPTEMAQLDVIVHKGFWHDPQPRLKVFSLLPGEPVVPQDGVARREVQVHQTVDRLSEGLRDLAVHDVPNYAQMIEAAIGGMGHSPSGFHGFRVRMKYPILSTAIVLETDLRDGPG